MRGLVAELSRRRVFRVAGLYGVVAWVIAEVSSVVFPVLLLPGWTVTFVVALLILGFPVAMILAWAYDIGPGGIEKTAPLEGRTGGGRAWIAYAVMLAVAMAGLGYFLWWRMDNPAAAEYESIAVMPFANLSGDESNDYFSDGMAEEILNLLAQVPGLQVAARTSAFAFKGQSVDVREVGRRLGVDAVLEGSVRKSGERVRITAQLVDAQTGYHLWSATYDRELSDIFAVQDEISAEIVRALKVTLGPDSGAPPALARAAPPTENLDAYQLYLQGRHQWKRRGAEAVNRSIELFRQAVELDPGFARAWAALAAAWAVLSTYDQQDGANAVEKATEAARRALALDPKLAEAHAVLAEVQSERWDWTGAEAGFFFATSLDPNDPTTRHWYSLLLCGTGRLEACLEQSAKAFDLDPASPVINYNLANAYLAQGYDDQARRYLRSAEELGLDVTADSTIGVMTSLRAGDMANFDRLVLESVEAAGLPARFARAASAAMADRGRVPELAALVEELDLPPEATLSLWVLLGETGRAMDALMTMAEARRGDLMIVWMPEGRAIRQDPRFAEFARRAGLVEYWKQYGMPDDCRLAGETLRCGYATVAAR